MMSDGTLTQEEIDALLKSSNDVNVSQAGISNPGIVQERLQLFEELLKSILPSQQQKLNEAINARSTVAYNQSSLSEKDILNDIPNKAVHIVRHLVGADKAEIAFIISSEDALQIASYIIGQDNLEINDALLTALQEMVVSISEPLLVQMGELKGSPIEVEKTTVEHVEADSIELPNSPSIVTSYTITVKTRSITLYMAIDPTTVDQFSDATEQLAETSDISMEESPMAIDSPPPALGMIPPAPQPVAPAAAPIPSTVQPVSYGQLSQHDNPQGQGNLGLLMDVEMELAVELGRTRRKIKDILQFGEGSIIELDKLAGEPVDILINKRMIAKGEVVVIDENFGVRITEVLSPLASLADF